MRLGELPALDWSSVDLKTRIATLRDTRVARPAQGRPHLAVRGRSFALCGYDHFPQSVCHPLQFAAGRSVKKAGATKGGTSRQKILRHIHRRRGRLHKPSRFAETRKSGRTLISRVHIHGLVDDPSGPAQIPSALIRLQRARVPRSAPLRVRVSRTAADCDLRKARRRQSSK